MFDWRRKEEWLQLVRYYAAGVLNMAFGYVLFAILIALGMQVYAAQALGYVLGLLFNYVTYSRFAFAGQQANKTSFVASYVANYVVSLALLWLTLKVLPEPLIAGLVVTIAASLVNYLVLKKLVFRLTASA